ncbi:MAG: pseudouridine synthase [Chloroflexota bacterium]
MTNDSPERIQKLMAQAGYGSRRSCEKIIEQGRVTVNGQMITLGDKADPRVDDIRVDGERLKLDEIELVYYVINKPPNVLSTRSDLPDDDRPTVRELIDVEGHLFTIGRLDAESEGLMVLTNDGDLTNKLAHPRYEHTKTYKVTVYGEPSEEKLEEWQNGLFLGPGEKTAPCYVKVLEANRAQNTTTLRVVMIEGKKRQIRRVATMLGHPVRKLMRTHIGQLGIGTLRRGEWYRLSDEEVKYMSEPAWELEVIRKRRRILREQRKRERNQGR